MILVLCQDCRICLRIMGDAQEAFFLIGEGSDFWPNKYPCPFCEKEVEGFLELRVDPRIHNLVKSIELTPQEAFAAFNGLGLPSEHDCTLMAVQEVIREKPVRKCVGKPIQGTTRCVIDYLEFWDGTRLYLGAGAEGAVAYRLVRPVNYVRNVDGTDSAGG